MADSPPKKNSPPRTDKKPVRGKTTPAARTRTKRPWSHVQCIYSLLAIAVLVVIFLGAMLYLFAALDVPDLASVSTYRPKMTSRILDSDGRVIERIFEENRVVVPLSSMPDLLPKAFVAAEDARFYSHEGVDIWSISRALLHNLQAGVRAHGGSTITQQVTRSLLLTRKKLYSRKLKEAILAYRIDSQLSKDDILYIYLNQIYLGEGAYGVEAAALTYFGKSVGQLNLGEMALLAGLPQSPSRYSPLKDLDLAQKRQVYVLNRMAEEKYITAEQARQAYQHPLSFAGPEERKVGGYFIQQVTKYIEERYGYDMLVSGGLTIKTSLDAALQLQAEDAVRLGVEALHVETAEKPQACLVAVETKTGKIRAHVGGVDFNSSQFDRVVQARRQPGSAMKPLVFAVALEQGFRPDSTIDDQPLRLPGAQQGQVWEPQNFDGQYHGPTSLEDALVHSRNVVAVKLLQQIGIDPVIGLAKKLGIHSPMARDLSLALGSSILTPLELTSAYTVFGNGGRYAPPLYIYSVIDRDGTVLEENHPQAGKVLGAETAEKITAMLQKAIRLGTGHLAAGLDIPAAGKTGTTDDNHDAWFIGYTSDLTVGVWVGFDKGRSLGKGQTGGLVAAPIWLDFMKRARALKRQ